MKQRTMFAMLGGAAVAVVGTSLLLKASAGAGRYSVGLNADWGGPNVDWLAHISENLLLSPSDLAAYGLSSGPMRMEGFTPASPRYTYCEQIFAQFPSNQWVVPLGEIALTDAYGTSWTLADWDQYVSDYVSAHKFVHMWEIWHEVTNTNRWTGYLLANGWAGYAQMLKDAYAIIKRNNPNDTVIAFGGLFGFNNSDSAVQNINAGNWALLAQYQDVQAVVNAGARNYFDAWSTHIYTNSTPDDATNLSYFPGDSFVSYPSSIACSLTVGQAIAGLLNSIRKNLLPSKPLHITEFGMPASNGTNPWYTPQKQERFANEMLSYFSGGSIGPVSTAIWWTMINSAWGLWDPRTVPPTPRPALDVLKFFAT